MSEGLGSARRNCIVIALKTGLIAQKCKAALPKDIDGRVVLWPRESMDLRRRQHLERKFQGGLDKFGSKTVAPSARSKGVTNFQAPVRLVRVDAETAPANDGAARSRPKYPRRESKGSAHDLVRVQALHAVLAGRRHVRVPHRNRVAHDDEQCIAVARLEWSKHEALGIQICECHGLLFCAA